ncbi:MAG: ComF family protein [Clostridiales bacterium]|jgi:ComF family protein|nr:ComF family protein [Clostridiales bacterium]
MFERLLRFVYPDRCLLCDDILPIGVKADAGLRRSDTDKMELIEKYVCVKCGKDAYNNDALKSFIFLDRSVKTDKIAKVSAVFEYKGIARDAVRRFKFNGRADYARAFAAFMAEKFTDACPTDACPVDKAVIIPTPMHKKKLRERGYNQAELLAKNLASLMDAPFAPKALARVKNTSPQYGLSYEQRRKNVAGAFLVVDSAAISGESALLIDDIYTTGATLDSCAEALLKAGSKKVYGLCLSAIERHETDVS